MQTDHRRSPLQKHDLQYSYPEPLTGGDDPTKREEPDRTLLNRSQWYEMLYFCNRFANENLNGKKDVALRVERLIKDGFVPSNLHKQDKIEQFIIDNWLSGPD